MTRHEIKATETEILTLQTKLTQHVQDAIDAPHEPAAREHLGKAAALRLRIEKLRAHLLYLTLMLERDDMN